MKKTLLYILTLLLLLSCKQNPKKEVTIFYAATFASLMNEIKTDYTDALLKTEVSGSQVAIRKVTELGRDADIVMSADKSLFSSIGKEKFTSRIDFAGDEIVLGVGQRAKFIDESEKNWVEILKKPEISLGRVNENLGPIGYRTIFTWKLMEQQNHPGLTETLIKKTEKVVDHVSAIAALLKAADIEYGFLYKSTAIKNDIRYIPLSKEINLGADTVDYSNTKTTFNKIENGIKKEITVTASQIVYSLSIVDSAINKEDALLFIKQLLSQQEIMKHHGFSPKSPIFYGTKNDYEIYKDFTSYGGEF